MPLAADSEDNDGEHDDDTDTNHDGDAGQKASSLKMLQVVESPIRCTLNL